MYRILIVEDDPSMADVIRRQMEAWGNQVSVVKDFQNVLQAFTEFDPHLVLLDIMLPFYNGYYWCTEIRKISDVPVIFISSASDNMNLVMAINMGGDDFIAKPFDLNVLNAKVQAILRRTYDLAGIAIHASKSFICLLGKVLSSISPSIPTTISSSPYRV